MDISPRHIIAPAKINLGLSITGKRADGYHDILSLFQTIDLCDELLMIPAETTSLTCNIPSLPTDGSNLVLRAHESFCNSFGMCGNYTYDLTKNIPSGAGLGGGSTDAAAVLRGLADSGGKPDASQLNTVAASVGADVPFFLTGGTAIVSGIGEIIEPVEWPFDFTYVLVYPGFPVSSGWAYRNLRGFHDDGGCYEDMILRLREGRCDEDHFFSCREERFR